MRKRHFWILSAVALSLVVPPASAATPNELERVAEKAIAARQRMMQQDATAADVSAFLAFCTDDLVYEDPVVKMKIAGKAQIQEGMTGFLGATRKASIAVTKRIARANVVVLEQTVSFEAKEDDGRWKPQSRDQVTILEFEGFRIRRIADYWPR